MDDKTLLGIMLHGLPKELAEARNDVNTQQMDLRTALAYMERAEDLANTYGEQQHRVCQTNAKDRPHFGVSFYQHEKMLPS